MSQLRRELRFGFRARVRWLRQRLRLGYLGERVFFDADVHLLRHPRNIRIGTDVIVKRGAHICSCNATAAVEIGPRTTIGYHTFIFASERIEIGSDCLIAPFVYIVDSDHGIVRSRLINQQDNVTGAIRIGNDVWVATGARILKGVTIGDGAVVAANAVVAHDVGAFTIVGGVPARVIGERA